MVKIKCVLISVSDETGIIDFARELSKLGIEIIATSGTLEFLEKGGIKFVKHVSDITGFPEILDGRVKTMHPKLIGGVLALRNKKEHMNELKQHGITPIDMVVCNLYPFEKAISQRGNLEALLEQIDIGGPNLIRAAAKNFENVVVITNPKRYGQILEELKKKGDVSIQTKFTLAKEAFKETARYDRVIYKALESACA
jgi:phosphoribosylaminoimidazolecarboxamide formyltransferase/IMP cyclohydrolase